MPEPACGGARPSVQLLTETLSRNNVLVVFTALRVPEVKDVVANPDVVQCVEGGVPTLDSAVGGNNRRDGFGSVRKQRRVVLRCGGFLDTFMDDRSDIVVVHVLALGQKGRGHPCRIRPGGVLRRKCCASQSQGKSRKMHGCETVL